MHTWHFTCFQWRNGNNTEKKTPMSGQYHKVTSTNIAIDSIIVIILSTTKKEQFFSIAIFFVFVHIRSMTKKQAQSDGCREKNQHTEYEHHEIRSNESYIHEHAGNCATEKGWSGFEFSKGDSRKNVYSINDKPELNAQTFGRL